MTYKIVRMYQHKKSRKIKGGLTLEEAKEHCRSPKTRGVGWFDGYEEEKVKRHRKTNPHKSWIGA